jgi:zinc protease
MNLTSFASICGAMLLAGCVAGCATTPRAVAPLRYTPAPTAPEESFRASPPPLAEVVEARDRPATQVVLPNGLRVVLVERHDFPLVAAVLLVDRGALDVGDPAGRRVAETTYLFAGGGDENSFEKRSRELATSGVAWTSGQGLDGVWSGVKGPSASFDDALRILAETSFQARLSPSEYARRSSELLQSARAGSSSVAFGERAVLFGKTHAYGYQRPSTSSIELADAQALHDRLYQPTHTTLFVVGDVAPAQVEGSAKRWLGAWRDSKTIDRQVAQAPLLDGLKVGIIPHRSLAQTHAVVFARGPDIASDDLDAFALAAELLGGAKSSKVFEQLREEGAAYTVIAPLRLGRAATWMALTGSYDREKAVEGVRTLLSAIEHLCMGKISDEEIATARETLLAHWRDEMEGVHGAALVYANQFAIGCGPECVNDYPARITKIRREDLLRVAKQYLARTALHVVFMGDDESLDVGVLGMGEAKFLR